MVKGKYSVEAREEVISLLNKFLSNNDSTLENSAVIVSHMVCNSGNMKQQSVELLLSDISTGTFIERNN